MNILIYIFSKTSWGRGSENRPFFEGGCFLFIIFISENIEHPGFFRKKQKPKTKNQKMI